MLWIIISLSNAVIHFLNAHFLGVVKFRAMAVSPKTAWILLGETLESSLRHCM